MAEATLANQGSQKTKLAEDHEAALMRASNAPREVTILGAGVDREIRYHIYLYTTSKREYLIEHPPYAKKLKVPGVGTPSTSKAKPDLWTGDDTCRLFAVLPDVLVNYELDVFTGSMRKNEEDGRRVAMDILCSANSSIDQDLQINNDIVNLNGKNYLAAGLFFSLNNPPKQEEIAKAVGRMETYYRALLQRAKNEEIRGPQALRAFLDENSEAFSAANHFGEKVSWNSIVEAPEICSLSGASFKKGAAWHTIDGFACIHDWKRAVSAGFKKKEDVPDEHRWWTAEAKPTEAKQEPKKT